jgi:hypothetical protein
MNVLLRGGPYDGESVEASACDVYVIRSLASMSDVSKLESVEVQFHRYERAGADVFVYAGIDPD